MTTGGIIMTGFAETHYLRLSNDSQAATVRFNVSLRLASTFSTQDDRLDVFLNADSIDGVSYYDIDADGAILQQWCQRNYTAERCQEIHDLFEQTMPIRRTDSRRTEESGLSTIGGIASTSNQVNELMSQTELQMKSFASVSNDGMPGTVDDTRIWGMKDQTVMNGTTKIQLSLPQDSAVTTNVSTTLSDEPHYDTKASKYLEEYDALRASNQVQAVPLPGSSRGETQNVLNKIKDAKSKSETSMEHLHGQTLKVTGYLPPSAFFCFYSCPFARWHCP